MAGYHGHSKSNNALLAEEEWKLPLTRAVREVARHAGCSQSMARLALADIGPCEWHHTSKMFRRTDYYSVAAAVLRARSEPVVAALEAADYRARIESIGIAGSLADREDDFRRISETLASEAGCSPELVLTAYYGTWNDDATESD